MAECRDTTPEDLRYNPKDDAKSFKARHARSLSFLKFKNPIPEQTRDQDDLQKLFEKYLLVPFAGSDQYSGQRYLAFLRLLRNYSETHGSCCESKLEFSFGGKAIVQYETDDFFDFEDDAGEKSVPIELKKQFAEYARKAINWDASSIRQFVENAVDDWLWSGNYYVELIHTVTAGIWKTYAYVRYPEDCIYVWSEAHQQKVIATSPSWDLKYITDHPPNVLPVYPKYKREGNKWSTIIHEMHGNFPWYGRPNSRHAILPMYNEFQNSEFMVKHANAMFMAQILMEAEEYADPERAEPFGSESEAKEKGYDNSLDRLEQQWTAKGDNPGTVIATSRPSGAKPMFVHEFKPYTNENYYEKVGIMNEKKIIRAHSWSSRLLGDSVANGLSTNVFKDEFGVKAATNIRKLQNMGDWLTNTIITEAMKFHGFRGMEDLRLAFKSPFQEMLEQTEELEDQTGKPNGKPE